MNILSIETSADETAISIIGAQGDFPNATYTILGNSLRSQIETHRQYGGIFPTMAKRDHARALTPLLHNSLKEAGLLASATSELTTVQKQLLTDILAEREPELLTQLSALLEKYEKPEIDLIAMTVGPGLEPALWVGVNFAKVLALTWNVPVVPVNHMEGHVLASIFDGQKLADTKFPALALLISGGHTEFVLMSEWMSYTCIGQTRDDAVGEAFDKVARQIGLPYPGGPEIEKLAHIARTKNIPEYIHLPRPMINSQNLDFSFSGLKTAVRYAVQDKELSGSDQQALARDFEDAVTEVLYVKTKQAIGAHGIQSLIIGGGVSANSHIRQQLRQLLNAEYPDVSIYVPDPKLATDNSVMIALAGHARANEARASEDIQSVRADGNLSLS